MLVSLENVSFRYPNSNRLILNNVSFMVESGTYLSVLGENGSGKTTLMKLILGLNKPDSGKIICKAKKIGYVPQQKANFFQLPITVNEFLLVAKKTLCLKDKSLVDQVLSAVNLPHKKDSLLGNLSGGELQRIFIAQALLGEPDLLILDEPSTGVDIESQSRLYTLISELNKNKKITIISVEHNLQAAMHNSSEIFHLENGIGHICSPRQYADEYLSSSFYRNNSDV